MPEVADVAGMREVEDEEADALSQVAPASTTRHLNSLPNSKEHPAYLHLVFQTARRLPFVLLPLPGRGELGLRLVPHFRVSHLQDSQFLSLVR